jgi:hypothetical protein
MLECDVARSIRTDDGRVRRPSHAWTPTVHALLAHLRAAGVSGVPAPLAITNEYEEVSRLSGDAGAACWPYQATEQGLRSAAHMLRRLHDATISWVPPSDAVWGVPPTEPPEVVCHGDPGPWNMTWIDGQAAGLFDWDFCHPGPRLEDVAYALGHLAPFRDDDTAMRWHGLPARPTAGADSKFPARSTASPSLVWSTRSSTFRGW